jgi:hypothetical protein
MKISLTYLFCIVLFFSNMRAYSQDFYGSKTLTEIRNDELVEMKTLKNSFAIGLQCGYFGLFSFAKANEYSSNVRIGDYHNQCNLNIEYYPSEKSAVLLTVGLFLISKETNIDNISWTDGAGIGGIEVQGSGKGGAVIPVTLRIKRTLSGGLVRPYVSLSSGFTYIKIGSGTGSGSIYGVDKNIDYQSAFKFCWLLGSGIQMRMGKVVRLDCGLNYYGTPHISPTIGGINSYSGLYLLEV